MDTEDEGDQHWRRGEEDPRARWQGETKAQGPSTGTAPLSQFPAAIDWRGLSGRGSRPQDW